MIKNFKEFILEKDENDPWKPKLTPQKMDSLSSDARINSLFQDIDRDFNNYPSLGALRASEIQITQEIRSWSGFQEKAELNTVKKEPCRLFLKFEKGPEQYKVDLEFELSYKGVENYDIPEPDYNYAVSDKRLGVSLERIHITRITVKSDTAQFDSTEFNKTLRRTVDRFIVTLIRPDFDMIGDPAVLIAQP
jgi:hypothetical protein